MANDLIPRDIADTLASAKEEAGFQRGRVNGIAWTVGVVVFLILAFFVKSSFAQVPREALEFRRDLIRETRFKWGLNGPSASFAAQIHQESRWNAGARSRVGAQGLTQFMPATAKWISEFDPQLAQNTPYNPQWAIRALVTYNKYLWDRVDAVNDCERLAFAMAAYNGGLGWTFKRKAIAEISGVSPKRCFNQACDINPGITPANQRENQEYPRRILLKHEPMYVTAGFGRGACEAYALGK